MMKKILKKKQVSKSNKVYAYVEEAKSNSSSCEGGKRNDASLCGW